MSLSNSILFLVCGLGFIFHSDITLSDDVENVIQRLKTTEEQLSELNLTVVCKATAKIVEANVVKGPDDDAPAATNVLRTIRESQIVWEFRTDGSERYEALTVNSTKEDASSERQQLFVSVFDALQGRGRCVITYQLPNGMVRQSDKSVDRLLMGHLDPRKLVSAIANISASKFLERFNAKIVDTVELDGRKLTILQTDPTVIVKDEAYARIWVDTERGSIKRLQLYGRVSPKDDWGLVTQTDAIQFDEYDGIWLPRFSHQWVYRLTADGQAERVAAENVEFQTWNVAASLPDERFAFDLPLDDFKLLLTQ